MSEVEIDMSKVAVHVSIVEKISLVETTGLNFNTPLEMKSKTPGTLDGMMGTVQVTARPLQLFIPVAKHHALLLELAKRGIVCVAPDPVEWADGIVRWCAFAKRSKRMTGSVLHAALTAIGVNAALLVQIGDQMPVADFVRDVGPFLDASDDAQFTVDITSTRSGTGPNARKLPLGYVVGNSKNTATLNMLGSLGTSHGGPSGSVRITCPANSYLLADDPSALVEYIMIYPKLTHLLKAIGIPDHLPKFTTQEHVKRFRYKLEAWIAQVQSGDELAVALLNAVCGKYRIEMRCVYTGSGASFCAMLTDYAAHAGATLADVERISGVKVANKFVSKELYFSLLRDARERLDDPEWAIGRGDRKAAVPDVVVSRVLDILAFIGIVAGLFRTMNMASKQRTWWRPPNNLPTKEEIGASNYVWEPIMPLPQPVARRSGVLHVPPQQAPPQQAAPAPPAHQRDDDGNDDDEVVPANRRPSAAQMQRDMDNIKANIQVSSGPVAGHAYARDWDGHVRMSAATLDDLVKRIYTTYGDQWEAKVQTKARAAQVIEERKRRNNEAHKLRRQNARRQRQQQQQPG